MKTIDAQPVDIIVDVEATCWDDDSHPKEEMEIIEIGAVALDHTGKTIDDFTIFIKPVRNPVLSDFCTKLTTITQTQVDGGVSFRDALFAFFQWVLGNAGSAGYRLWTWGQYDRTQFERDCIYHGVGSDWLEGNHRNLKTAFAKRRSDRKEMGTKRAILISGLEWYGTHHRGIDDAINIAQIFNLNRDWYVHNVKPTH